MSEFNQAKYIQQFQKEKYDRCVFNVPKGQKEVLERHWKKKGYKSFNSYINNLIEEDMKQTGKEITSEKSQSDKILTKLYEIEKELSEEELLYLLDTIKALKKRLS